VGEFWIPRTILIEKNIINRLDSTESVLTIMSAKKILQSCNVLVGLICWSSSISLISYLFEFCKCLKVKPSLTSCLSLTWYSYQDTPHTSTSTAYHKPRPVCIVAIVYFPEKVMSLVSGKMMNYSASSWTVVQSVLFPT
jgi:hypothetical protein